MQHDELIWGVLNGQFCAFKSKLQKNSTFCRNEYNLTGLCNRTSCPLSNSRYATVREHDGICYLYMKTIERAHTPNKMWEKVKLSRNYKKALEQIDSQLMYWPDKMIHKNKQRLTKIHQYLIRMRKLTMKTKPKLQVINKKIERRENRRQDKAKVAAKLESSIEKELIERLQKGTYGDIYNFPEKSYTKVLDDMEIMEEEEESEAEMEYVEDFEQSDDEFEDYEQNSDNDSDGPSNVCPQKSSKPYIEIEYEQEVETMQ